MTIHISLPFPPSVNRAWRAVKGRVIKSAPYRKWEVEALTSIKRQYSGEPIAGKYHLRLFFERPDKRRRDIGNLEKTISDALQTAGVIADDCNAESILLQWGGVGKTVRAEIEEIEQ